jgi:hypothetical protein
MKKPTRAKAIHKSLIESQKEIDYIVQIKEEKAKTLNSTTKAEVLDKITDWHHDIFSWRQKPVSEAFINNLCEQMIVWINTDQEALLFEEFLHKKNLLDTTFMDWAKKWPKLEMAHQYVLRAIGIRREKMALRGEINQSLVAFVQPHYSKVWKQQTEWRSKLKTQEGDLVKGEKDVVYVITDKIPNIESVKDRNERNDPSSSK